MIGNFESTAPVEQLKWRDYLFVALIFLVFHLGYYLIIQYTDDDHLVLRSSFLGASTMYGYYGKPELAYVFEGLRWINDLNPLLLRTLVMITSVAYVLLFMNILQREVQDRFSSIASTLFLSSIFIWSANLFIIIYPYLYSMLFLALFVRLAQDSLERSVFRWTHAAGFVLLGLAGVSYEPLVIFMPLMLAVLMARRGIDFRQALREARLRNMLVFTGLAILIQLIWYKLTPANGLYAGVNPASVQSILRTIPQLPLYVGKFIGTALAVSVSGLRKFGFVDGAVGAVMLGGILLYLIRLGRSESRSLRHGYAVLLFGLAFIALGLLPFIVAEKVNLKLIGHLTSPFGNRHYFLAATGLAIMMAGAAVVARHYRSGGSVFAAAIGLVTVFGYGNYQNLYYSIASREMLTVGVVKVAIDDPRTKAAQTLVIDPSVAIGAQRELLSGWALWGPGYTWRFYGGDASKLVIDSLMPRTVQFIHDRIVRGHFWYRYPHTVEQGQPISCFAASAEHFLSRAEVRQLFWSYYLDREAFFRSLSGNISLNKVDCAPVPAVR